jgi:chondroitin AC lyase
LKHILKGILTLVAICISVPGLAEADDFSVIKGRVVADLMRRSSSDDRVQSTIDGMKADGRFEGINYADLSRRAGFPQGRHTSRLVTLAIAYNNETSSFYKSEALKEIITRGYRHWVDNDYFGENWHNNQITTPSNLVRLMLLIGDELPEDSVEKGQPIIGRAHMEASGARPSGDRIVIAGILAQNLLFRGDKEQFDQIIRLIEGEIKFSTGSRGMQHDYSFHHRQDRVNNTDSYGYGKYANTFGIWSSYVAGTDYAFSVEKLNHLVDYYLEGIYKQQVYGIYSDISVKNRSITRRSRGVRPRGTSEIERLLKGTDYRKDELEEIIRLRKGESKPSQSFAKFFWQTEHFVFQRPNFYTTVRMYSTRNRNMEVPYNGPGKPTHHRADGTNYLQLQGDEYLNIWPMYDWQKISGTTIVQKPELHPPTEIQKDGLTDFVGAVTDGLMGAVAFDFRSPHDRVKARKAWFFFNDEYVCLGAGITAPQRLPVVTTVNQVLMRSDVTISQNDQIAKLPPGDRPLKDVKWVHHDKIGYILPEPATIHLSNQAEQGRWSDITDQKNISDEVVSEDVFALWFDHGKRPTNASYQYIVVPDVSETEVAASSSNNRGIEILENEPDLQAVRHTSLDICQVAFYKAGEVEISKDVRIRMDSQGMAMVKLEGKRVRELSVSDPSRKLSRVAVTLSGRYQVSEGGVRAIQDEKSDNTLIMVDLPQGVYAGKSVSVAF